MPSPKPPARSTALRASPDRVSGKPHNPRFFSSTRPTLREPRRYAWLRTDPYRGVLAEAGNPDDRFSSNLQSTTWSEPAYGLNGLSRHLTDGNRCERLEIVTACHDLKVPLESLLRSGTVQRQCRRGDNWRETRDTATVGGPGRVYVRAPPCRRHEFEHHSIARHTAAKT